MSIPDRIPVQRQQDYYSGSVGLYDGDKQFWGRVVAEFARDLRGDKSTEQRKRWYAVFHKFDGGGEHIGTDHYFAGTTAEGESRVLAEANEKLDQFIARLKDVRYGDIAIKLFQIEIDGAPFGMVDMSGDINETVEMIPGPLFFCPPWDGDYST